MPELPEVETTRRGLARWLEGRVLADIQVRTDKLRFPLPPDLADRLAGSRVTKIDRRAKYLLVYLDNGYVLLAHLGMSGRFRIFPASDAAPTFGKHDHLVIITQDGAIVCFHDPRKFGVLDLVMESALDSHPLLRSLGPEPLADDFCARTLGASLAGKRTPIKAALLDQRVVAGLGNIYVSEALYHAGISPRRSSATIPGRRADRLVAAIRTVLKDAIAAGGSSLRDFQDTEGKLGYFQTRFAVYGREGRSCPRCPETGTKPCAIKRIVQSGRSSFYCPAQQR